MNGKVKSFYLVRSRACSMRRNSFPSEEIYTSMGISYRYVWNWAQLPDEIKGYQIAGVTCDSYGYVYASTRRPGYPIAVFNPDGSFIKYVGTDTEIIEAHGISIDSERNIWLADDRGHVVRKFNQDGKLIQTIGAFKCPSDTGINNIEPESRFSFYTERRLAGPFNRPTRIIEASNHHLFASDGYGNAAIHEFDNNGNLLNTWGGMGKEPGHFGIVHSLWIDREDRIWVADREFDRVQVFTQDGHLIKILDNLMYPTDIVSDENHIFVAEREGRISIFDYEFNLISQIGYWLSPLMPHSIAVDKDSNLYLGLLFDDYTLTKLERI